MIGGKWLKDEQEFDLLLSSSHHFICKIGFYSTAWNNHIHNSGVANTMLLSFYWSTLLKNGPTLLRTSKRVEKGMCNLSYRHTGEARTGRSNASGPVSAALASPAWQVPHLFASCPVLEQPLLEIQILKSWCWKEWSAIGQQTSWHAYLGKK